VRLFRLLATAAIAAVAAVDPAVAADQPVLPIKAPTKSPAYDWNGFYFGGHVGYGQGRANATVTDPAVTSLANTFGGNIAGVQLGYNMVLASRVLLGLETDLTFANYLDSNALLAAVPTARSNVREEYDYTGTVRARLGYVVDPRWMVYGTGGFAFAGTRMLNMPGIDEEKKLNVRPGWSLGAGLEYALSPHWSARAEYLYNQYIGADAQFPSGTHYSSTFNFQELRIGLNRKLGAASSIEGDAKIGTESDRWELHAQTTYIQQGYPTFRSPYQGTNSLSPFAQTRETWSMSAFAGVRLWDGGAVYFNPELLQGFGLSDTVGLGGYSNGEASAASRRRWRARPTSCPTRSTSRGSRSRPGGSPSPTCSTTIPTPRIRARTS
jgi:high affinity Mn2+ porin